ncbi:hypothetical protein PUR28_19945 [Streptomyces sp. BE308]|uniref:hypothetical protein n=1 Tax=unclassified Streptomyces TaxID=2593676 RepID=UPI002DDBD3B5|nr:MULTISPECIES: hypothetical protein [unclassified Streptomyces]MEE1792999.1 hypothetical protein [Streptomyces sp. BE308]WRZ77416.1 hypothetical protein OG251_37910 [Streptomyces sp. NBC_01237]
MTATRLPHSRRLGSTPVRVADGRTALVAFHAFRALYREGYLAYATARLGADGAAEQAVEDMLTALAVRWSITLGCSHPAAVAWRLLSESVDHIAGATGAPCSCRRRWVSDAFVLRGHLRMETTRAAELMGLTHGEFLVALHTAGDDGPGPCSCGAPPRRCTGA